MYVAREGAGVCRYVCGFFVHLEDILKQNSLSHLGKMLVTIIHGVFYGDRNNDLNH